MSWATSYDAAADSLLLHLVGGGHYARTIRSGDGNLIVDLDEDGKVVGVEMLGVVARAKVVAYVEGVRNAAASGEEPAA